MKRFFTTVLLALAVWSFSTPVSAQEESQLKPGDDAPPISLNHWWNNQKLESLAKGNVYLIDFWASWCPPCRESFPHVAQLKQKYADQDVEVVALSIDDRVRDAAQFLNSVGTPLGFYVGWDNQKTAWTEWGKAANRDSIPTAFLVDRNGKIAWIGHPGEAEKPLKKILAEQPPEIKVID